MTSVPNRSTLRPVRDFLTWRMLFGSVILTLAATLLLLWRPRLLGDLVESLAEPSFTPRDLLGRTGSYLGIALVGAVFSKWMRQVPMRWGPRIGHQLRTRLHRHLLYLDENQIHDQRVGELMSRLQSDVNAVQMMIALGGHSLIRAGFTLGIAFWMMFQRSPAMAVVVSFLLPALMLIGFVMIHSIRARHLMVQEQLGRISSYCQESFGGLRLLRGLGLGKIRTGVFGELNREFMKRSLFLSRIEVLAWPLIQTGFVAGNVLLIWIGGMRVIRGEMELGMLVEFQQYLMILQWPSLSIAWTLSLVLRGRASCGRLQEILDIRPQITESSSVVPADENRGTGIVYENISLSMGGREVLKDICFRAEPGQNLGITGPTGSGKTLLAQLLLRRQDPTEGRITLGGVDLRDLPLDTIYDRCRIAPQEPVLFSMTLEENLKLAAPDVSEEMLHRALYVSALDRDLAQLADGLQTQIGERGVTLSGGQRQRCAIARALLSDPEVLILDDSLSAVDTSTESMILERLLPVMQNRTLILISHRYAALRQCDNVLVLKDGGILEQGTPESLLAAGGAFSELAERQRLQAKLEVGDE